MAKIVRMERNVNYREDREYYDNKRRLEESTKGCVFSLVGIIVLLLACAITQLLR